MNLWSDNFVQQDSLDEFLYQHPLVGTEATCSNFHALLDGNIAQEAPRDSEVRPNNMVTQPRAST